MTSELIHMIREAAPHDEEGRPVLSAAFFDQAVFHDARFHGVIFQHEAVFDDAVFRSEAGFFDARFEGEAWFDRVIFDGEALFQHACFPGVARFVETCFKTTASFGWASFQDLAGFEGAMFHGRALFPGTRFAREALFGPGRPGGSDSPATFEDSTSFDKATFEGPAVFNGVTFQGAATFDGVTFADDVNVIGAIFEEEASFRRATFQHARELGPMIARRQVTLDRAVFRERIRIAACAGAICCRETQFSAGVQMQLRWANVVLDGADLASPSILAGAAGFPIVIEEPFARRWQRLRLGPRNERWRPRLLGLRHANVAGLTVSNIDLRPCRFIGAHNLDKLRIEESPFAFSPQGWRWTTRQTIAEEQYFRAARQEGKRIPNRRRRGDFRRQAQDKMQGRGWHGLACRAPAWFDDEQSALLQPMQIANLYRALRKAYEDNRDEPGAADFYYGEMEMRRLGKREQAKQALKRSDVGSWLTTLAEVTILTLYWLVCGYALRAWRALTALAAVIILAAMIFAGPGFSTESPACKQVGASQTGSAIYRCDNLGQESFYEQLPDAVTYSAEAATSLLRSPDRDLTRIGEWTQILLRLLGPVLLGLAVLSLRGRVKR